MSMSEWTLSAPQQSLKRRIPCRLVLDGVMSQKSTGETSSLLPPRHSGSQSRSRDSAAHLDLPKSVEGYYQETGRAGLPADAWMAYGLQDVVQLRRMIDESEAGEAQKRIQAAKLDAMLGLCETAECRRVRLLGYFGEAAAPCGNCDTCLDPPATFDGTLAAQQLLSCVYRTGQRFGAMHVIDVLRGEATAKVTQRRHDKLSTFGIGAGRSGREWRAIVRQCIALGLLEVDHDSYGALKLTPASRARTGAKHGSRPGSNARGRRRHARRDSR